MRKWVKLHTVRKPDVPFCLKVLTFKQTNKIPIDNLVAQCQKQGHIHFWFIPGALTESLHQTEIGFLKKVVSINICMLQY